MKTFFTLLCIPMAILLHAGHFSTNNLLFHSSVAQVALVSKDTNQLDANGQKTGFWTERIGGYEWHGYYVSGKKNGAFVAYPLGLNLFAFVESYNMGKKDGVFLYTDRAGYVIKEEFYKDDSLDGYRRTYYTGGRVKTEEHYKNGKLDGYKRVYNASNKISEEGFYVNCVRSGVNRWYYTDGRLNTESNYVNGSLEG